MPQRNLCTYTVEPRGVVLRVASSSGDELRFRAVLSKSTGCGVLNDVVVRDSLDHPTLVDDVESAFARVGRARLVVEFQRERDLSGPHPRIRSVVRAESMFGARSARDNSQMDLFA